MANVARAEAVSPEGVAGMAPASWDRGIPDPFECEPQSEDERCERWAAVYDDETMYGERPLYRADDRVMRLAVSTDGDRVFTFGRSCSYLSILNPDSEEACRWSIVAHRAGSGDEAWRAHEWASRVSPETGLELSPDLKDFAISSDGARLYATGAVMGSTREGDWDPLLNTGTITIAWDAVTGQKLWERFYTGDPVGHRDGDPHDLHAPDQGMAVAPDPQSDRLYVVGYTETPAGHYDVLVVAYDGASGTRLWVATYDTSTPQSSYANDRALPRMGAVSPDGKTLFVGARLGPQYRLLAFRARDPGNPAREGAMLWASEPLGPISPNSSPESLDVGPDGSRVYVHQRSQSSGQIAAFDAATGQRVWARGTGPSRTPALSPDGDRLYVVAGGTLTSFDAASGEQIWNASYPYSAGAVGVSPDGQRVYVTGTRPGGLPHEGRQLTVAYDAADGGQLWSAVYSLFLNQEEGSLLDVGPDGTVFTAGDLVRTLEWTTSAGNTRPTSLPSGNLTDWGVQAYEA